MTEILSAFPFFFFLPGSFPSFHELDGVAPLHLRHCTSHQSEPGTSAILHPPFTKFTRVHGAARQASGGGGGILETHSSLSHYHHHHLVLTLHPSPLPEPSVPQVRQSPKRQQTVWFRDPDFSHTQFSAASRMLTRCCFVARCPVIRESSLRTALPPLGFQRTAFLRVT